jgi:hypothetical protein
MPSDDFGRTLLAAAGSAGVSALVVSPLDTLRVRWQVTANAGSAGLSRFAVGIVKAEGVVHGLVRPGLTANVLAIAMCSGVRFTLYSSVRFFLIPTSRCTTT